jgi:hypothetical protein
MHLALRSSLAIVLVVACAACQTHDRRNYSTHRDKNLHTPDPWSASTTKAADDATSPLEETTPPPAPSNGPTSGTSAQ